MKVNYQKMLDEKIEEIKKQNIKPSLLLHACCAPCSSAVLEYLYEHFNITLFFYNPNISPESEFNYRLEELKRLIAEMNFNNIEIVVPNYDNNEFEELAKGLENLPEGDKRCKNCYRLRLKKTAEYAKEKGFDFFTTTLSVSPYKNAAWLNEIGERLQDKYGVKYLYADFKKQGGYYRSQELSKEHDLYRQDYCGCRFSKADRQQKTGETD
jgi:predicted adenine nucleotide alpha hydrolase (AANH) superfamily ATPase